MSTLSSLLAWEIPWTEEPCGLQSSGLLIVEHDWDWACTHKIIWWPHAFVYIVSTKRIFVEWRNERVLKWRSSSSFLTNSSFHLLHLQSCFTLIHFHQHSWKMFVFLLFIKISIGILPVTDGRFTASARPKPKKNVIDEFFLWTKWIYIWNLSGKSPST